MTGSPSPRSLSSRPLERLPLTLDFGAAGRHHRTHVLARLPARQFPCLLDVTVRIRKRSTFGSAPAGGHRSSSRGSTCLVLLPIPTRIDIGKSTGASSPTALAAASSTCCTLNSAQTSARICLIPGVTPHSGHNKDPAANCRARIKLRDYVAGSDCTQGQHRDNNERDHATSPEDEVFWIQPILETTFIF
jgi:hypothetical protein